MTDAITKFLDELHAEGIAPHSAEDIKADDVRRRYRVAGDRAGSLNGEYVLREDADGFAVGFARSWKSGAVVSWHTRSGRKATDEQKQEWNDRREELRAKREAEEAAMRERGKAEANRIWNDGSECYEHPYATRKLVGCAGVREWLDIDRFEVALLVPICKSGEVVGLQKIYPDGDKMFTPGSDVSGGWFEIPGDGVTAVCEGWATGQTIAQATGWRVCVAFNAGNLVKVAKTIGEGVVICSDEDIWTFAHGKKPEGLGDVPKDDTRWPEWRDAGLTVNRGRVDAMQAAAAVGGALVLYPEEGGDWNDVHVARGIEEVSSRLLRAVERVKPLEEEWHRDDWQDSEPVGLSYDDVSLPLDLIKPLGHDRGTFYFFPKATGQIMEYTATGLAHPANLYAMADRDFWDSNYNQDGKMSSRQIADLASADLMRECRKKGIFNPDNSRGVGVWRDGTELVVNTGEEVMVVGGGRFKPQDYSGKAVYEAGPLVYDLGSSGLRNKESAAIRDIAKRFNWRQSIMGDLLAGFVVLAPIGGVLKWRPHVVVTGEKGAGKSTLLDNFIKMMIGDPGIFLDGGTTEAGMRKEIGLGAQPVVMDEGESETKKTRESMEGIFFLARRSSSGSKSATAFGRVNVRSCFCIAAINPRIVQGPDKDRWSTLELVKDTRDGREDRWRDLELDLRRVINEDTAKSLLARTIENLPTLLANIDVFRVAASKALGDARAGDQIGPLIAGAFSLVSTKKVNEEFASEWIAKQDWQWRDADVDVPEHEKFLATVLTMRLRYDKDGQGRESDIGAMIDAASRRDSITWAESVEGLKQIGVKVEDGRIVFANNSPKLASMLKDTVWSEWRRLLMKFDGADNCGNKTIRFGKGISGKAVSIPLYHAMEGEVVAVGSETPF